MDIASRALDHPRSNNREDKDEDDLAVETFLVQEERTGTIKSDFFEVPEYETPGETFYTENDLAAGETFLIRAERTEITDRGFYKIPGYETPSETFYTIDSSNHSRTTRGRGSIQLLEDSLLVPQPRVPTLDLHSFQGFRRPIGYEDRHRPGSDSGLVQERSHPQRYGTDWSSFRVSTTTTPSQDGAARGDVHFNIRASNLDMSLSDDEIQAFFSGRCGPIEKFRMQTVGRTKVAYLAIGDEAAKQLAMSLHGFQLGRRRVKMEWSLTT